MKRILLILLMLGGIAYGQCPEVTGLSVSNLSTTGGKATYTAASGATLYVWGIYVPGGAFVTGGSTTSTTFNFTGLTASTTYRLKVRTTCGLSVSGDDSLTFSTLSATAMYTPLTAQGYQIKYLKVDSGFNLPLRDTALLRGIDQAGAQVYKPGAGVFVYNGSYWQGISGGTGTIIITDSSRGIDSITFNGYMECIYLHDSITPRCWQLNTFFDDVRLSDDSTLYEFYNGDSLVKTVPSGIKNVGAVWPLSYDGVDLTTSKPFNDSLYLSSLVKHSDSLFSKKLTGDSVFVGLMSGSVSSTRFGIEDNLGIQDRSVTMQGKYFNMDWIDYFLITSENAYNVNRSGFYAGKSSNDTGYVASLFANSQDYDNRTDLEVRPYNAFFTHRYPTVGNIDTLNVPLRQGWLVASVNGVQPTDSTGNITISAGGSSSGIDSMYVTTDSLYQVFIYHSGRRDSVGYSGSSSSIDTSFLHGKIITSFTKNTARDSLILTLNDGTRYAVLDSTGGSSGITTVPNGGTGLSSLTPYAPIFGGTTSTGNVQSGTAGSLGQVLISNGASALPTFQTTNSIFPSQTGKVNNYLKSNGSTTSWTRFKFMNPAYWELFGDSYTLGNGATTPLTDAYYVLLSNLYNRTYTNRAVSGTGTWSAVKLHLANVNPPANTVSNIAMTSIMIGFNDLNRSGVNTKTVAKITNGLKAVITNHFALSMVDGFTGTGVTRTGTWATYNAITLGGGKYSTAASTATNGSHIDYSFIGDNIAIGLQARDGTSAIGATFSVTIDGVSQGSFTTNNQTDAVADATTPTSNTRGQMAINFLNLTDSNHTIVVTNISSDTLIVDYFAVLKKPAFCTPILVNEIPHVITYVSGSNALTDIANNSIDSLIDLYPNYPIIVSKTNNYLSDYNADNIHPSTKGHRQIFRGIADALDSLLNFNQQQLYVPTGNSKILGAIQVQGNVSGTLPTTLAGSGVDIFYNSGLTTSTIRSRDNTTPVYLPLNIFASDIILGIGGGTSLRAAATTGNVMIQNNGTYTDIPSSRLTVNAWGTTTSLPQASIPAPRISTNRRDSITSSVLTNTKTASGSGYSGTGTNVSFTCVSCANPLATGATAATVNVVAGAVTSNSAVLGGTNYTVGDTLTASFNSGTGFRVVVSTLNTSVKGAQVMDTSQNNLSVYNGANWSGMWPVTSSSTLTLLYGTDYIFNGTTATYTLPAVSSTILGRQNSILITNTGSGTITLNTNSGNHLMDVGSTTLVSTISILSGASCQILPTGTDFKVLYKQ